MTTIAEAVADFALSPSLRANVSLARRIEIYVLDTLAVALAGTVAPSSAAVARTISAAAGRPEATVFGLGRITSAWDAALANGAFGHALELDDDHRIAVLHPGTVVVPAALAAAEAAEADGTTLLRAVLVGYEVMCRLGEVFRGAQFYHGVHPTALCGVFGAAAASAVAQGLDRAQFVNALGIAGTQASGLTEWRADGSWIKRLHPGRAAQSGVLSARLAREGFTGPATIFEGANGFFNAFTYGEPTDPAAMTRELGSRFSAFRTAIKPFPCCRFEHGAIDLALAAYEQGVSTDSIERVDIRIYRTDVLSYHQVPRNPVDAQFNVPYAIAVALLRGRLTLNDFTEEAIRDERVLALARRIFVVEDVELTAKYPDNYEVFLRVRDTGGVEHEFFSDCPSGDPEARQYRGAPERLGQEVEKKAESLLSECGFAERAGPLREAIRALSASPNLDRLTRALGSGHVT
jgi:2-methylcitrate dehydratase PrpD